MGWSLWMVVMLIPLRNPWKMHILARKCAWTELKMQTVWVQTKYRGCLDCDSPLKGGAEDMDSRLIAKYTQIFVVYLLMSQSTQERVISSGSRRQSHKEKNRYGWHIRRFISLRYLLVNKLGANNCQLCFAMKIPTSAIKREIFKRKSHLNYCQPDWGRKPESQAALTYSESSANECSRRISTWAALPPHGMFKLLAPQLMVLPWVIVGLFRHGAQLVE